MNSRNIFRASLVALGVSAALGTGSAWAQTANPAPAQQGDDDSSEELNTITVTGSRTITDAVRSPTPLTSVDISALAVTTPSDVADALNKLPSILGGRTPRNQGNGGTNNGGNTLSLRNFGPSRTLVLLDGHRLAPSNQDGSVNIDVLPQMLVERVDIVTGGASAIYGSDAVAGVVNYVLDKDFTGLTVKADLGQSKYEDGDEYQFGAAWGTSLFSDRGHFEVAARIRHQDMIPISARPGGKDGQAWLLTGNGRVPDTGPGPINPANRPFEFTPYARVFNSGPAGNVQCNAVGWTLPPTCLFNNYTFNEAGALVPMVHGTPSASGGVESGGDGSYIKYGTFRSELDAKDIFARFSLDVGESANWYVQGSWAEAENASDWIQWVVSPNNGRPNTLFANNPYLSPTVQGQLGANIPCSDPVASAGRRCLPSTPPTSPQTGSTPPPPPNVPIFALPRYFNDVDGQPVNENPNRLYRTLGDQKAWNVETGITGDLGGFSWEAYYVHGVSELTVTNPNNTDNAKYLASLDAVNDNGTIRCWVTTQPQFASLYPGCVPANITDPGGLSADAYNYLRTSTSWLLTQEMDNVGASIGGNLWGLGLPAGDITANLSVDARWSTYVMESDFLPSDFVNCTGLRMCLAAGGAAPLRWVQNTNAPVDAKNHVYEGALEFNIPLLKEAPGFQDVSTNLAYRWTKYSTFDAVESWKLGLNWQIVDSLRFRSTLSSDIRAPNLNDLFQPAGVTSTSYNDRLTGGSAQGMRLATRGNPLLTPEEAKTFTAGVVFTPTFLPRFNLSLDFWETRLTHAITNLSYANDSVQAICLASAPSYSSPVCDLAVRPITNPSDPNYLNPAVNMPTEVRSAPVNAALLKTKGYDLQLDYNWELAGGQFSLRHLVSYQPVNSTLTTPTSAFYTWAVQPHWLQTTFLSYKNGSFGVSLQNRWLGSTSVKTSNNLLNGPPGGNQNYLDASLDANNVVDITLNKEFEVAGGTMDAFLTVSNLLDERAPLFPSNSGLPGLFYPTLGFYDDMGRYFTVGAKMKF
ncbi:MAG TPA: TonB-dependent receptor [Steroidobacteraceae bacterium]|nr:TonB-dependent receptor [Steroidobacteraceae bacterium]